MKKYLYKCTHPMLPPEAKSPVMDSRQMEDWLHHMQEHGWEFVSYSQKIWGGYEPHTQDWWIFRKEVDDGQRYAA